MNILRFKTWAFGFLFIALIENAQAATWASATTGGFINATVTEPNPVASPPALVIYLKNLSCERIGQEADASILASFTTNGCRVVTLDYAHNTNATSPFLNADVLKIRNDIGAPGAFPGSTGLNAAKSKVLHP